MLQINTTDAYLRSTFLVEFDKFSKNFIPVKPCIHLLAFGYRDLYWSEKYGIHNIFYTGNPFVSLRLILLYNFFIIIFGLLADLDLQYFGALVTDPTPALKFLTCLQTVENDIELLT